MIDVILEVYLDDVHVDAYLRSYGAQEIPQEAEQWKGQEVYFWKAARLPPIPLPQTKLMLLKGLFMFQVEDCLWFERKQKLLLKLEPDPCWDLVGPDDFDLTEWKIGEYMNSDEYAVHSSVRQWYIHFGGFLFCKELLWAIRDLCIIQVCT